MVFTCISLFVAGQRTVSVGGFSDSFYGKVFISSSKQPYSDGWVAVYEVATGREMAKTGCTGLQIQLDLTDDEDSLTYDEQGLLLYEDFTFDGVKDLALFNGQNGSFGSWTFDVYLGRDSTYTKEVPVVSESGDTMLVNQVTDTSWFEFSPVFTRIIKQDGVFFNSNSKKRTITLISKKQPNNYQYLLSTYEIRNNRPYLIKREEYKTFLR